MKFHLVYNPYLVETKLEIRLENSWVPVSEESGLLHISKARMQRWLEPSSILCNGKSYFDELMEASGERQLEIFFSGTKEDLSDLVEAAKNYTAANPQFKIKIIGDRQAAQNDSKQKFRELKNILQEARQSRFHVLLPEKFWRCTEKKIFDDNAATMDFIDLSDWQKNYMFETEAWQLLCLTFPFQEMYREKFRNKFRDFGECMAQVPNRNFERERFLLLCRCESNLLADSESSFGAVRKLLMEYGLQDLNFLLLTNEDFQTPRNTPPEKMSGRMRAAQKIISVFNQRYAEQYRLKKIHDVLEKILLKEGFVPERQKNIRKIEDILSNVSDKEKYTADKWICNLFGKLKTLLDIGEENIL